MRVLVGKRLNMVTCTACFLLEVRTTALRGNTGPTNGSTKVNKRLSQHECHQLCSLLQGYRVHVLYTIRIGTPAMHCRRLGDGALRATDLRTCLDTV